MSRSLYIAGSAADIDRCERWHQEARAAGIQVVSNWIENVRAVGESNPRDASPGQRYAWAHSDLDQVRRAGLLWFLAPPQFVHTRGAWVEFGYAQARLSMRKDIVLVVSGDTLQSIFCALGLEFEQDADAFDAVKGRCL